MTQQFTTTDVLKLEVEDPGIVTNLMPNPSFGVDSSGWSASALTLERRNVDEPVGNWFLRGTVTADGGAGPHLGFLGIPVIPGERYVASAFVRSSVGVSVGVQVRWRDSSNNILTTDGDPVTIGYTWTRLSTIAEPPAGGVAVDFLVRFMSAVTTGMVVDVAGAMLTEGTEPPPYFDGDTADTTEHTYNWTGTPHNSPSTRSPLVNLIQNPSGELGTFGWITPVADTRLRSVNYLGTPTIEYISPGALVPSYFYTEPLPVTAGNYVAASWGVVRANHYYRVRIEYLDPSLALLGSSPQTPYLTDAVEDHNTGPFLTPAGTAFVRFRLDHYKDTNGNPAPSYSELYLTRATVAEAALTGLPYLDPDANYLNVLGPTHEIKVTREALNVGTLNATILDATLDPATSATIRPGRRVRLLALDSDTDEWQPLFTGKTTHAAVAYHLKDPALNTGRRARIDMTAVDNTSPLANQQRSEGVAELDELPYVLEGCGVPWNVEGSGNQVPTAAVVSRNENASALDQIAVTRDTNLGYAWVDRSGTLQIWGADTISRDLGPVLDDTLVTDYDVSYNTDDCINEVQIVFLRLNPVTGDTEEVAYGPYRSETSIAEWGVRSAEFTIQGAAEETANIEAYAAGILAANEAPTVRVNAVTVAVSEPWMLTKDRALGDVMDYVQTSKTATPPTINENSFITGIEHTITTEKWLARFTLTSADVVASPQFTPSPSTGAGGKTIGQLLRPVGELTLFIGAKSNIPAGWLACDGSSFNAATYPDLAALLGTTTLPDFTDRLPMGAGTKFVRTTGGSPTKTLTVAQMPAHTHPMDHGHGGVKNNALGASTTTWAAGVNDGSNVETSPGSPVLNYSGNTGTRGNGQPLDVMNPWLAVWFIVRAV